MIAKSVAGDQGVIVPELDQRLVFFAKKHIALTQRRRQLRDTQQCEDFHELTAGDLDLKGVVRLNRYPDFFKGLL